MVRPFDARHEKLAGSLASQAAVALANSRLYESIRQLFEGFVQASVTAIESRDPSTSGHSFRVANLTVGLATVVDQASAGPFGGTRFSTDEMMELRYAALLHDFGKVGVREQVLVKAKKLYPGELDRIRQRVELVKRGLELRYAGKKIEYLLEKGRRRFQEQAAAYDAELAAYLAELDASLDRIVMANEPAVLPQDFVAQIERLHVALEDLGPRCDELGKLRRQRGIRRNPLAARRLVAGAHFPSGASKPQRTRNWSSWRTGSRSPISDRPWRIVFLGLQPFGSMELMWNRQHEPQASLGWRAERISMGDGEKASPHGS